jgi:D-sedoheptulose 7-phosphate isomerase
MSVARFRMVPRCWQTCVTIAAAMVEQEQKILAVMSDLFFLVKINDAAKKFGRSAEFVKDPELAMQKARLTPPLIILDLNCDAANPLALIRRLKSDSQTAAVPIVGFVSHVQTQLRQSAEAAGCDLVVARSTFSQDLASILERYLRNSVQGPEAGIRAIFQQTAANISRICEGPYLSQVTHAVDLLVKAFEGGNKVLIFGNGGSSADAHHITAEFVGRFARERRGLPAMALSSDPSILTALGNDYGFAAIFERQVEAHGKAGDIAWGISTSGKSPNVVRALQAARSLGLKTIGLTGQGGGEMADLCDVLLAVPVKETARIQELHILTYHSICEAVEARLFGA